MLTVGISPARNSDGTTPLVPGVTVGCSSDIEDVLKKRHRVGTNKEKKLKENK